MSHYYDGVKVLCNLLPSGGKLHVQRLPIIGDRWMEASVQRAAPPGGMRPPGLKSKAMFRVGKMLPKRGLIGPKNTAKKLCDFCFFHVF